MKLTEKLQAKHGTDLEEKSLTICSGTDYININYQHVVCPNSETAKVTTSPLCLSEPNQLTIPQLSWSGHFLASFLILE